MAVEWLRLLPALASCVDVNAVVARFCRVATPFFLRVSEGHAVSVRIRVNAGEPENCHLANSIGKLCTIELDRLGYILPNFVLLVRWDCRIKQNGWICCFTR